MLTFNLWVEAGLINGALGYIENIFFAPGWKPPQLPQFCTVMLEKYCGVPFDKDLPILVPITPIIKGNKMKIPLKIPWTLTIHKS